MTKTRTLIKGFIAFFLFSTNLFASQFVAPAPTERFDTFLQADISTEMVIEVGKSTIFDASKSYTEGNPVTYQWDFGDGNRSEGVEVLHAYKEPKNKIVTLTITTEDGFSSSTSREIFVYEKLFFLITDDESSRSTIEITKSIAQEEGVFVQEVNSFGSSTEFISEEILSKKLDTTSASIQQADFILIWSKENAGLNSLSRFYQTSTPEVRQVLAEKNIIVVSEDVDANTSRIERQYAIIKPKSITVVEEIAIPDLISSKNYDDFLQELEKEGQTYAVIDEKFNQLRPWNFMSYFVNAMIDSGIPDNTIALLLLLPVIVTVVAIMRQIIGITTFGVYTPSIITLSFLVIGIYAGLLTLLAAIVVSSLVRPLLRKIHMLFIPKMAIVITLVALSLLLISFFALRLNLFNPAFLSIAIFPMLILSTLVEKFISAKSDKSLWSAATLMGETLLVSVVAYVIAGGEINLGIIDLHIEFFKRLMLNHPEVILLLLLFNFGLGKWSGLRVLEKVRFREVLRHMEE